MIAIVTLVSVFPLYYTIVMASHTNAEMAAATPPLLPTTRLFGNLKAGARAGAAQPRPDQLADRRPAAVTARHRRVLHAGRVRLRQAARSAAATCCSALCIGTMMVPMQMGVIPLYMMMARLGLAGHLAR